MYLDEPSQKLSPAFRRSPEGVSHSWTCWGRGTWFLLAGRLTEGGSHLVRVSRKGASTQGGCTHPACSPPGSREAWRQSLKGVCLKHPRVTGAETQSLIWPGVAGKEAGDGGAAPGSQALRGALSISSVAQTSPEPGLHPSVPMQMRGKPARQTDQQLLLTAASLPGPCA